MRASPAEPTGDAEPVAPRTPAAPKPPPGPRGAQAEDRNAARDLFHYGLYRIAKGGLGLLPRRTVRRFGGWLGPLGGVVMRSRRELGLRNLALVMPELDEVERERVMSRCFRHFGSTFPEIALAEKLTPETIEALFDVEGWGHVEAARADGRGLIFVGAHFGSFEVAGYLLALRLGSLHVVARPQNNYRVDLDMRRTRERFGLQLVDKYGAGHRMLNVLRKQGHVGILVDQRIPAPVGVPVPFFGRPAHTSLVTAFLSIYTGAPAVPMFCEPIGADRYRLRCLAPIRPEGAERTEEGKIALTRRYLEVVENEIRRQPHLWLWPHRRWELGRAGRVR